MNNPSSRPISSRTLAKKSGVLLSLALAFGLFANNVLAQVLVVDTATEASTNASVLKQIDQYLMQGQQYANQLQQYAQMLSQIQGLSTGLSLLPNTLQHADANALTNANCAGGSGSFLNSLAGSVINDVTSMITGNTPVAEQQQQICARIIYFQVDEYNKTVDMLNQVNNYSTMFTKVEGVLNSVSTLADAGRANNQAQDYANAMTTQMVNWRSQMQADDSIIKMLQSQQSLLARTVFSAHPDLVGQATQAAALTAAFAD